MPPKRPVDLSALESGTLPLPSAARPTRGAGKLVLRVSEGPDAGKRLPFLGSPVRIGTAPECELVLTDPTVSRVHATLRSRDSGFLLGDHDSTNGTFLEDHRIREAFLEPGRPFRLGSTTLVLDPGDRPAPLAPLEAHHFGGMMGRSLLARRFFALLDRIAPSDVTVILHGETGTGKEEAARSIHLHSLRRDGPFEILDCSALDRDLVSAHLFGHEPGAFTGAMGSRPGSFERANGGTLFIDEIGELSSELQPKLLRALESGTVTRLGGSQPIAFSCRVVAATHRDLGEMVTAGKFRQDLFYRLAQIEVTLPPLRARREDVPLIVDRFVAIERERRKRAGDVREVPDFSPEAMDILSACPWPGNIRELRNAVVRALAMCRETQVTPADLMIGPRPGEDPSTPDLVGRTLEEIEREAIARTLLALDGNRTQVSKTLGISPNTLRDKIKRYGLE